MELERRFKRLEERVTSLTSKLVATEKWQRAIEPWLLNTFQLDIHELIDSTPEPELATEDETTTTELGENVYFKISDSDQRKRKASDWNDEDGPNREDLIELRSDDICIPTFSISEYENVNEVEDNDAVPSPKKGRTNIGTLEVTCSPSSPSKIADNQVMSFFCSPFPFSIEGETVSIVEIPNMSPFEHIEFIEEPEPDVETNGIKQEGEEAESQIADEIINDGSQEITEAEELVDETVGEQYYYNDEAEDYIEEIVESVSVSEPAAEEIVPNSPDSPEPLPRINLKDWEMKCIICLKHFASSIRLVNHEERVHEVKKGHALKCMFQPSCRLIFRGVRQLSVHMKAKHTEDYERLLKQNINPVRDFSMTSLVTPVSDSTLELLREADNEALERKVALPKDWNTTNYFSEEWPRLMKQYQDGIMPHAVISKREDLKVWLEYLPNELEPHNARYRCRLCFNYAHYLQLAINSVYLLAKSEGQLRETESLNLRAINHHNRNSLTHKSIVRLLKELSDWEGDDD